MKKILLLLFSVLLLISFVACSNQSNVKKELDAGEIVQVFIKAIQEQDKDTLKQFKGYENVTDLDNKGLAVLGDVISEENKEILVDKIFSSLYLEPDIYNESYDKNQEGENEANVFVMINAINLNKLVKNIINKYAYGNSLLVSRDNLSEEQKIELENYILKEIDRFIETSEYKGSKVYISFVQKDGKWEIVQDDLELLNAIWGDLLRLSRKTVEYNNHQERFVDIY